jgi:hypothetical protein
MARQHNHTKPNICWCWARDGSSPKFGNKKGKKLSLSLERRDAEEKNEKKLFVAVFSTERKGEYGNPKWRISSTLRTCMSRLKEKVRSQKR